MCIRCCYLGTLEKLQLKIWGRAGPGKAIQGLLGYTNKLCLAFPGHKESRRALSCPEDVICLRPCRWV